MTMRSETRRCERLRDRLVALAGACATVALLGAATPACAEDVTLHMAVPDWPPTRIMKDMFDKKYKATSGNTVKLDVDFIPWPDYYTRLNASLTSGEKKYNMVVSDSQWLGAFIEGGYYLQDQQVHRCRSRPAGSLQASCIRR